MDLLNEMKMDMDTLDLNTRDTVDETDLLKAFPLSDQDATTRVIPSLLDDIEKEHNVSIVLAVESGSRMWGFPSPDSDYDVRFVYVKKDPLWYRSYKHIGTTWKDTITHMTPCKRFDLIGWDISKFLRYIAKSNVSVCEWTYSTIVYQCLPDFLTRVRAYLQESMCRQSLFSQYRGMLLSDKAAGTENVKRMMYLARIVMMLRQLTIDRPRSFRWPDLIASDLATLEEKHVFESLFSKKIQSMEKHHSELPQDSVDLLQRLRDHYQDVSVYEIPKHVMPELDPLESIFADTVCSVSI